MTEFGFQWHLTDHCNLRCRHCYQDVFTPGREKSLAFQVRMARAVFQTLAPRGISVNLTGGEPFLLPHLADLVEALHELENLDALHIITNGTRAPAALLERLRRAPKLRSLKISIESSDAATNDAIRGPGNLERVRRLLPQLLAAEKPLVLMVTLGQHNLGQIPQLVDWAQEQRCAGLIFERFVPLGQGRALAPQALGIQGWARAVQLILDAAGFEAEPEDLLPFRAFWLSLEPDADEPLQGARCQLGPESMALMPDGTVFPCRRLPLPLGNVLEQPFEEIWRELHTYSRGSLPVPPGNPLCGACDLIECLSCRALVQSLDGAPPGADPPCPCCSS